MERNLRRPTR